MDKCLAYDDQWIFNYSVSMLWARFLAKQIRVRYFGYLRQFGRVGGVGGRRYNYYRLFLGKRT